MSIERDVDFLFEMGMLRYLPRQWSRFNGIPFANLTEHHFRMTWIALVIAKHEKVENTEKIMKMAMAHDIAESRTNDVDYMSRQYVVRNEELALKDILEDTSIEAEFSKLLDEYEKRESIESKIVKDADTLDIDFELKEQASNGFVIMGKAEMRQKVAETQFFTKSAKKLYDKLQKSDPNNWHINSKRNRINSGDWKQK